MIIHRVCPLRKDRRIPDALRLVSSLPVSISTSALNDAGEPRGTPPGPASILALRGELCRARSEHRRRQHRLGSPWTAGHHLDSARPSVHLQDLASSSCEHRDALTRNRRYAPPSIPHTFPGRVST